MPRIEWQWKRLAGLAPAELYALLAARAAVFVVEQQCAFLDLDGLDASAWHLLGWAGGDEARTLAAYLRLIDPGCKYPEPSIGRVLTTAPYRFCDTVAERYDQQSAACCQWPRRAA